MTPGAFAETLDRGPELVAATHTPGTPTRFEIPSETWPMLAIWMNNGELSLLVASGSGLQIVNAKESTCVPSTPSAHLLMTSCP